MITWLLFSERIFIKTIFEKSITYTFLYIPPNIFGNDDDYNNKNYMYTLDF